MTSTQWIVGGSCAVVIFFLGAGAGYRYAQPKPLVELRAIEPKKQEKLPDGAVLAARNPPQAKPETTIKLPLGSKVKRVVNTVVQPPKLTVDCTEVGKKEVTPAAFTIQQVLVEDSSGSERTAVKADKAGIVSSVETPAFTFKPERKNSLTVLSMPDDNGKWRVGAVITHKFTLFGPLHAGAGVIGTTPVAAIRIDF